MVFMSLGFKSGCGIGPNNNEIIGNRLCGRRVEIQAIEKSLRQPDNEIFFVRHNKSVRSAYVKRFATLMASAFSLDLSE
jgi:hypothetical protein